MARKVYLGTNLINDSYVGLDKIDITVKRGVRYPAVLIVGEQTCRFVDSGNQSIGMINYDGEEDISFRTFDIDTQTQNAQIVNVDDVNYINVFGGINDVNETGSYGGFVQFVDNEPNQTFSEARKFKFNSRTGWPFVYTEDNVGNTYHSGFINGFNYDGTDYPMATITKLTASLLEPDLDFRDNFWNGNTSFSGSNGNNIPAILYYDSDINKIWAAGTFISSSGDYTGSLAKINMDGTIEDVYGIYTKVEPNVLNDFDVERNMAKTTDNKLLVPGSFVEWDGTSLNNNIGTSSLARFTESGTLDTSFGTGGLVTFTTASQHTISLVDSIAVDENNKIYVAGNFTEVNGSTSFGIVRLNSNGSVDTSYNVGSGATTTNGTSADRVKVVKIDDEGKIWLGAMNQYSGSNSNGIVRTNTNGTIHTSYDGLMQVNASNPVDNIIFFERVIPPA